MSGLLQCNASNICCSSELVLIHEYANKVGDI